jgi:hypothetical protein
LSIAANKKRELLKMPKKIMLINADQPEECRVVVLEDGKVEELIVEHASHEQIKGNIFNRSGFSRYWKQKIRIFAVQGCPEGFLPANWREKSKNADSGCSGARAKTPGPGCERGEGRKRPFFNELDQPSGPVSGFDGGAGSQRGFQKN